MKEKTLKIIIVILFLIIVGLIIALVISNNKEEKDCSNKSRASVTNKCKANKYTVCVKNYVGLNAANVGEEGISGDRREMFSHAGGYIYFAFKTEDGSFVDTKNEEELKQYVVIAQDYEPNTEIKLTFKKLDDGTESRIVESQSIEEITLTVKKIN